MTYQAYDINGYRFYTEERDRSSEYQNSEVANIHTPKTQEVFHTNSVFDELELVMETTTSCRTSHG
jgi:hypothetical protein